MNTTLTAPLRIVLADDHTLMRHGLRKIFEERPDWQIAGEAGNGREAVKLALEMKPDVLILDIAMPQLNGIEVARQVLRREPKIAILVLSMYADEAYVVQAMQAGAKGYLLKDSADVDLLKAVESVARGKSFLSPKVAKIMSNDYLRMLREKGVTDRFETLSEREREVFQLVAEGYSNKEIAELLCLSPTTVETHRARILEKLDLHSAAEIVLYAVRKGVIS